MFSSGWVRIALGAAGFLVATVAWSTTYSLGGKPTKLFSDEHGTCYARSVPSSRQGLPGGTNIFLVNRKNDALVYKFPWYSYQLAIKCGTIRPKGSISVVRMGPAWRSESGEVSGSVTLAFYLDGKLLAEYSRMDILVLPEDRSVYGRSPRRAYGKILGYRRAYRRDVFEICTTRNRILLFDISNGDLVGESTDNTNRCGDER